MLHRLESLLSVGNVSTVNRLQQLYTNMTRSPGGDKRLVSPALWLHDVITPVMVSLACLVLGIAAIILILLVKHFRYEAEPAIQYRQVSSKILRKDHQKPFVYIFSLNIQ